MSDLVVGRLNKHGRPGLPVSIGLCEKELRRRARPGAKAPALHHPVTARAILDTTRFVTSVSARVLKAVEAKCNVVAGGIRKIDLERGYCVSIALHSVTGERMVLRNVLVSAHKAGDEDAAVMIGLDVLRKLSITLDGPGRQMTISRGQDR